MHAVRSRPPRPKERPNLCGLCLGYGFPPFKAKSPCINQGWCRVRVGLQISLAWLHKPDISSELSLTLPFATSLLLFCAGRPQILLF